MSSLENQPPLSESSSLAEVLPQRPDETNEHQRKEALLRICNILPQPIQTALGLSTTGDQISPEQLLETLSTVIPEELQNLYARRYPPKNTEDAYNKYLLIQSGWKDPTKNKQALEEILRQATAVLEWEEKEHEVIESLSQQNLQVLQTEFLRQVAIADLKTPFAYKSYPVLIPAERENLKNVTKLLTEKSQSSPLKGDLKKIYQGENLSELDSEANCFVRQLLATSPNQREALAELYQLELPSHTAHETLQQLMKHLEGMQRAFEANRDNTADMLKKLVAKNIEWEIERKLNDLKAERDNLPSLGVTWEKIFTEYGQQAPDFYRKQEEEPAVRTSAENVIKELHEEIKEAEQRLLKELEADYLKELEAFLPSDIPELQKTCKEVLQDLELKLERLRKLSNKVSGPHRWLNPAARTLDRQLTTDERKGKLKKAYDKLYSLITSLERELEKKSEFCLKFRQDIGIFLQSR